MIHIINEANGCGCAIRYVLRQPLDVPFTVFRQPFQAAQPLNDTLSIKKFGIMHIPQIIKCQCTVALPSLIPRSLFIKKIIYDFVNQMIKLNEIRKI